MRQLLVIVALVAVLAAALSQSHHEPEREPLYNGLTVSAEGLPLPESARVADGQILVPVGTAAALRWELALQGLPSKARGRGSLEELKATVPVKWSEPFLCDDPAVARGALHLSQLYGYPLVLQRPLPTVEHFAKKQIKTQQDLDQVFGPNRALVRISGEWELGPPVCKCGPGAHGPRRGNHTVPLTKRLDADVWLYPEVEKQADKIKLIVKGSVGIDTARGDTLTLTLLKP